MAEPDSNSKISGALFINNTIKVLDLKKENGKVWYKIDGGQYPGSFIDSRFVSPIAQPATEKKIIIPSKVKADDYWIDTICLQKFWFYIKTIK
jgi:hypothetical protein